MKEVLRATSFSLLPLELGGFGVWSALEVDNFPSTSVSFRAQEKDLSLLTLT